MLIGKGRFPSRMARYLPSWLGNTVPSAEFKGAFVPGQATTLQIMVKDSKKYASTGGWGFGRFIDGKPVDEAQHKTCFTRHEANVKGHDFVFTRYAP
jgi:hypothetical protein